MKKVIDLFNFLSLGAFLTAAILFVGDLFGFSLGINFHLLWRILAGFLALTVLLNTGNIKKIIKVSNFSRKFLLLSGLNLFLFTLFLLFFPIFRFGSPFVWEDRIPNFKAVKKIEITLNEPLKQSFQAKSNNLGTIGLKIVGEEQEIASESGQATISGLIKREPEIDEKTDEEELEEELVFGTPDKIIFRIKEEKENISNLTANIGSSSSLFGYQIQKESANNDSHIFEKGRSSDEYFYENTYELTSGLQTSYFLFGFPIQYESKDKIYTIEIEKIEEGVTGRTFLVEINSEGNFNFYPRYVYSLKEFKSNYQQVFLNISRKTNQFLEEKINQFNLIFVFLFIEFLIFVFLKKEQKYFKEKIRNIFIYIFLLCLLLIAMSSLNSEFTQNILFQRFINFLSSHNLILIILTFGLGFQIFCFSKGGVEKEIKEEESKNWLHIAFLIIIIFVAGLFSFNYIKNHTFAQDEMHIVWSALNILEDEGPLDINGDEHGLAFPLAYFTAFSFKVLGVSEFSARFFNVIFFLGSLILIYLIGKTFISKEIGILAMFISAFNVINFAEILELKVYAIFQFLFLFGIFSLHKWEENHWSINSPWLYLLIINILIGIRTHVGYLAFLVISFLYIIYSLWQSRDKILSKLKSFYINKKHNIIIVSIMLIGILLYFFFFNERIIYNFTALTKYLLGEWGRFATNVDSFTFYPKVFFEKMPFLVILLIPSLVILLRRYKKLGLYLSLFFIVPFVAQNFFIVRKATRYVSYFLPIFFLISVIFWETLLPTFRKLTRKKIANYILVIIFVLSVGIILASPTKTYGVVIDPIGSGKDTDVLKMHYLWYDIRDYLDNHMSGNDIIISNEFTRTAFYLPNPEYSIGCQSDFNSDGKIIKNHTPAVNRLWNKNNLQYEVITDVETLNQIMQNRSGWFIVKRIRFEQDHLCQKDLLNFASNNMNLIADIRGVLLYKWGN